jgi:cytochrome b561
MRAEPSLGWTKAQRRLHWSTAVLVLLVFPLGWLMVGVPLSQLLLKFLLYQLHKTLGILAFALSVTRQRARRTVETAWKCPERCPPTGRPEFRRRGLTMGSVIP